MSKGKGIDVSAPSAGVNLRTRNQISDLSGATSFASQAYLHAELSGLFSDYFLKTTIQISLRGVN